MSVDLNYPDKPAPGTVIEGYDENMDKPRPSCLDEYLESVAILYEKQSSDLCVTGISTSSSLSTTLVLWVVSLFLHLPCSDVFYK